MSPQPSSTHWITSDNELLQVCQKCQQSDAVALDTEFIRTDTYYPIPALIQIAAGNDIYLIDPLKIDHWNPLTKLLADTSVPKVIHSCREDLEVLRQLTDIPPCSLIDTQLMAAFSGIGYSSSYRDTVKTLLGIDLQKEATRTNWLARPLSTAQIQYAVADVLYLLPVYRVMLKMLQNKESLQWFLQDCSQLGRTDPSHPAGWKRVKNAWKLSPRQLAALQALYDFREQQAIEQNTPKGRVLPNLCLWPIARRIPDSLQSLSSVRELPAAGKKKYGKDIVQIMKTVHSLPDDVLPDRLPGPLTKPAQRYSKLIRSWIQQRSLDLGLPVELLCNKALAKAILHRWQSTGEFHPPEYVQDWRREEVVLPLLNALNQHQLNEINTSSTR